MRKRAIIVLAALCLTAAACGQRNAGDAEASSDNAAAVAAAAGANQVTSIPGYTPEGPVGNTAADGGQP